MSETLFSRIAAVLDETPAFHNPYFAALRDKTFALDDFVETQIQFYHAVVYFCRPMAVLGARIPDPVLRAPILRNVWEESGEGDPTKAHGATFLEFLRRISGVVPADIDRRAVWPEIRIFNTTLAGTSALDGYLTGAATFGIIERMFCEISSWIGIGVVENGWLSPDRMIHYNMHEVLDVRHSQDFFDVLAPAWEDAAKRPEIEHGLRMGATVFGGLYEGLYRHRKRRLSADAAAHVNAAHVDAAH